MTITKARQHTRKILEKDSCPLEYPVSLENLTGVEKKWVFIHTHFPLQGHVYINGKVVHWDNYRGQTSNEPRD
ncbi:MAG: hypothetical protein LC657_11815, partial [Desulfobacteraceae bacterium]|nr:hypothetical protein [Desulfobacteraceae bacterium]